MVDAFSIIECSWHSFIAEWFALCQLLPVLITNVLWRMTYIVHVHVVGVNAGLSLQCRKFTNYSTCSCFKVSICDPCKLIIKAGAWYMCEYILWLEDGFVYMYILSYEPARYGYWKQYEYFKCLILQLLICISNYDTGDIGYTYSGFRVPHQIFICALRLFCVWSDPCSILSTAVLSSHRFIPLFDTTADDVMD